MVKMVSHLQASGRATDGVYVQAYQRLIWTADMGMVYNPSVIPVSFVHHTIEDCGETKQAYTVGAGEKLILK